MSCCNDFPDSPDFDCGGNRFNGRNPAQIQGGERIIQQRLREEGIKQLEQALSNEHDEIEIKMLYVTMKMCAQNNDYERAAAIQGMILDRISIDSLFA